MKTLALRVASIAALIFAALTLASRLAAAGPGNFTGAWRLNPELSDDPQQKMEEARKDRRGVGAGPVMPPRGGFGGRGRGGGARMEEGEGPPNLSQLFENLDVLKIDHQEPRLAITDAAGREHVLYTDGRKIEEERSAGKATLRAKWKDGALVVTTKPSRGPEITEAYSVTAEGDCLTVIMKVEGRRGDLTIKRVYDAVKPNGTPESAPSNPPGPAPQASSG